jgi:Leucine-rich repeat (LRR) protein
MMMTSSVNRAEAVRKYFTTTPDKPVEPDYSSNKNKMGVGGGLIVLALILFLSKQGLLVLLGIISGYFGFKLLNDGFSTYSRRKKDYEKDYEKYEKDYERAMPKPSDKEMDQWLENDIQKIVDESLKRLDLEHDDYKSNPLWIGGPATGIKEIKYAKGEDKKTRYSHFNILVVYLTEYHVATYQCHNEMYHGQTINDRTQEFPYKEITNLGTQTIKERIRLLDDILDFESGMQEFTLATSGANVISVAYKFARNADSEGELVSIGGGEDTIAAIRKKLKDYQQKYER